MFADSSRGLAGTRAAAAGPAELRIPAEILEQRLVSFTTRAPSSDYLQKSSRPKQSYNSALLPTRNQQHEGQTEINPQTEVNLTELDQKK